MEAELLLAAAHLHPRPADVSRANAAMANASIEWKHVIPLAHRHGVLPLLYRHLSTQTFDPRLVPESALDLMRQDVERSVQRSLMLAAELVSLVNALEHEGIRAVPLKGPVLAQQVYGTVALRRILDLDLLVAEKDVERAVGLMVERGYRRPSSWGSSTLDALHHDVNHDVILHSTARSFRVELHYYLYQPLGRQRWRLADIEDELEPYSFFGNSVWVMRPETLLVYLCVHGTLHAWERIEWIGGVAQLLRSGRVSNWEWVAESARRRAAEGALRSGLHLVEELFDVPIPTTELRGGWLSRGAAHSVARRLTSDPHKVSSPTATLVHHVRTETGIRSRLMRVWSTLFVPLVEDRATMPLPRALSPLHYVLRPARLVLKRLRRLAAPTAHQP
jgi:hypothetical protein